MRWMLTIVCLAGSLWAGEDVVKNGAFTDGVAGWSETGSDDKHEVGVVQENGHPLLLLKRKVAGAEPAVHAVQYNLKFKPQTLYRLTITGKGDIGATIGFKQHSSKDAEYDKVCKSWATNCCPLPASKDFVTQTLIFDTGLKVDGGFVNVSLAGDQPGSYWVQKVAGEEIGPSKPRADETVILHIGDSISITSYLPFNDRIHSLLDARFKKEMPDRAVRNVNMAADGEYIQELLDTGRYTRLAKENLEKVDIAVIRYGSNDSKKFSPEEFKKYLATLCDTLQKDYPGIKIVLGTGTWLPKNDEANKRYGAYWAVCRDLAKERQYPLADICAKFEADGTWKLLKAEGDMHPSAAGVQVAADTEWEILKGLVAAKK